jgi:hypothetical protein
MDSKEKHENWKTDVGSAIRDSFMDYGGVPNVVDGLMAIAKAIDKLSEVIENSNVKFIKI